MFATIKSLIPEPRQAFQPRHYVGRHRRIEAAAATGVSMVTESSKMPTLPVLSAEEPAASV
jgi:hypothetical protein